MPGFNARKILTRTIEDWPVKAVCIALAILLFVFHKTSAVKERFFSAPLTIEGLSSLVPAGTYPQMIRVSLRGDPNNIDPVQESDIEVYVDMSGFTSPGSYPVAVQYRKKGTALGVEPLEITVEPLEITLALDLKVSKFVPLVAGLRGSVSQGYVLDSYTLNPTQVIVEGPQGLMESVTALTTDDIDLDGRTGDFTVVAGIQNRDPLITIRGTGVTEFQGFISRLIPVRNISDIPIRISGLAEDLSGELDVKSGRAHLEGRVAGADLGTAAGRTALPGAAADQEQAQAELDRFTLPRNFLVVDCSAIKVPGTYTLKVEALGVPDTLTCRVEPAEVTMLVVARPVEEEEP